jgi:hypothetical protein
MFSLRSQHDYYNPNLAITNYFETVVNELDIKTETILAELSAASTTELDCCSKKDNVNRIRELFIAELRRIEKDNLSLLKIEKAAESDEITNQWRPDQFFRNFSFLIDKSCFQLDPNDSSFLQEKKFELGVLILTNEFIEPDEINDLKKFLKLSLENKSLLSYFFEVNSDIKNVSFHEINKRCIFTKFFTQFQSKLIYFYA